MPNIAAGSPVSALDFPPTVAVTDNTSISNQNSMTYSQGSPEVGAQFVAPTTGRVVITVGAGVRNNAATSDRIFVTVQVFSGSNATGTQVLAPSVTFYGVASAVGATTADFQYLSRSQLLDGLTPGQTYYARVMHACSAAPGTGTVDLNSRTLMVQPAT